jgi:GNAT superfamily N-acetyltransferase
MQLQPLTEVHLDEAAALLATRHRADRQREPTLPGQFEDTSVARAGLQVALDRPGARGVVALQGGHMVGYLVGFVVSPPATSFAALIYMPHSVNIPYIGHAVANSDGEIYRYMYAALAPAWLAAGCFSHYVWLPAGDTQAVDAWFSLNFGRETVHAVRETSTAVPVGVGDAVVIRRAGPEDVDEITELTLANWRYHTGSPVFLPFLPDVEQELRKEPSELLADPTSATWLAYRDGHAVGVVIMTPSHQGMGVPARCVELYHGYTDTAARGGGVATALLSEAMSWARKTGYQYCELKFFSANVLGSRFWVGSGFRPLSYRLFRRIDERTALANS